MEDLILKHMHSPFSIILVNVSLKKREQPVYYRYMSVIEHGHSGEELCS